MALTYDLDVQSLDSYDHDVAFSYAKVQSKRSVDSKDRAEANGRTNRRTDEGDSLFPANLLASTEKLK